MTETILNDPASQEQPASGARLEIVHYPNYDIVINKYAEHATFAGRLAELFKNGTPGDWQAIAPEYGKDEDSEDEWDFSFGPKPGMSIGSVEGHQFLLKVKQNSGQNYKRRKATSEAHSSINLGPNYPNFREGVRITQRLNSVVNELAIAPKVKNVVASPAFQELAKRYGFNSIRYIDPIIGIVDKETGVKSLVYEYIPDTKNVAALLGDSRDVSLLDLDDDLEDLLLRNGIRANNDSGHHQLLADSGKNLHMIDAETFSQVKEKPESDD